MPRHREIKNRVGVHRISLQNYADNFQLDPTIPFVKRALLEVSDYESIASKTI
jgi:hypothetical protein